MTALSRGDNYQGMPDETKTCPFCAETIKAAAIVCRFCHRDLAPHPGSDGPVRLRTQPDPVTETTLLEGEDVLITSARVVIAGKTYATANITSVTVASESFGGNFGGILLVGGVGAVFTAFGFYTEFLSPAWVGGLMLFSAGYWLRTGKTKYGIRIGTGGGEPVILSHYDQAYIQQVALALNEAIVHRG